MALVAKPMIAKSVFHERLLKDILGIGRGKIEHTGTPHVIAEAIHRLLYVERLAHTHPEL